ncbi:MAG: ferritin family protein [Pseudomonadota bacterium]
MTTLVTQPIQDVAEFLAHALELEVESAERYRELSDSMDVHNNPEVAELFRKLARYGDAHAEEVMALAREFVLPKISPWDFKWNCPDSPELPCMDDAHYLMTKCQALELALHNEERGRDFYVEVVGNSPDAEVRRIAGEMADEEETHVAMLREWMAREACEIQTVPEDLDPPNMPE